MPLLEDLCRFCGDDSLSAITQSAIAHAQFETIHPFADGNGPVGRALIYVILRRRGLATRTLPPISLILATDAQAYIEGLVRTRFDGAPESVQAFDGYNAWIERFAIATRRSVAGAEHFEEDISRMVVSWRERLQPIRANSTLDILLARLPGAPIVTVSSAAELTGRSFQATNAAIARLHQAGILKSVRVGKRNRAFEASGLIDSFTKFERRLASPSADTRVEPPTRPVPRLVRR